MTARLLPREEWAKLHGTELDAAVPYLPEPTHVVVVEQDGQIVGCWALMSYLHVEGLYIAPEHRKRGRVGWRLWQAMRDLVRSQGASVVLTAALSDEVRTLLAHVGATKLPGDHYVLPMGER